MCELNQVRIHQSRRGIIFIAIAMLIMSMQDAIIKWLTEAFPVVQILFVRSLVMAIPVILLLQIRHGLVGFTTQRPLSHLIRLGLNLVTFFLFFSGLARLPLADAFVLMLTSPLFLIVLSGPLLGEKPSRAAIFATLVGFIGVVFLFDPLVIDRSDEPDFHGMVMVLSASVFYALWTIYTRRLAKTETNSTMVLYSALGTSAVCALVVPFYWQPLGTQLQWTALGLIGLISALGHAMIVQAYRLAPVYLISPFDYTCLVWGILFGYWIWGDLPTTSVWIGAFFILCSGLLLYFNPSSSNRRRS